MRLYLEVANRSFRQQLTYRAATLAGLFTNTVFGVFLATVFIAFYRSNGDGGAAVSGWTMSQTVTMTWINQSIIMLIFIWGWWEIAVTVQSGAVVTDLLKPMNYFGYWLSRDLGRAFAQVFIRFAPTFLMGCLLFDIEPPASFANAIACAISITMAIALSFTWRFMLNVCTFWVLDYRGINMMAMAAVNILSGFLMPLAFFPDLLHPVLYALPFRGMVQMPSEMYLGQSGIAGGLLFQAVWLVVLIAAAQWLFGRAQRKVVVQGG
jgi:ABC-2 type transport system permease protein